VNYVYWRAIWALWERRKTKRHQDPYDVLLFCVSRIHKSGIEAAWRDANLLIATLFRPPAAQ
jgi:hypothetical protein